MTLRTVLLSLQALLAAAEPDDPQDAVVANQVRTDRLSLSLSVFTSLTELPLSLFFHPQYKQNQEMFKQTARLWSHIYAGAPVTSPDYKHKIDKLCAMGFDTVRTAVCLCCSMFKILHNTHM